MTIHKGRGNENECFLFRSFIPEYQGITMNEIQLNGQSVLSLSFAAVQACNVTE